MGNCCVANSEKSAFGKPRPNSHEFQDGPPSARPANKVEASEPKSNLHNSHPHHTNGKALRAPEVVATEPSEQEVIDDEHFGVMRSIVIDTCQRLCAGLQQQQAAFTRLALLRGLKSHFDLAYSKYFADWFMKHLELDLSNVASSADPSESARLRFLSILEAAAEAPFKYTRTNSPAEARLMVSDLIRAADATHRLLEATIAFAKQHNMSDLADFFQLFDASVHIFLNGNIAESQVFYANIDNLTGSA